MVLSNSSSLINCLICGPTKISSFSFPSLKCTNFLRIYLKHFPSLFRAFTNYFISPNLIWSGVRNTFAGSIKDSWITFFEPGSEFSRGFQFFFIQCSFLALLSHLHKKQGYLVKPDCWPRRSPLTFMSTQIDH